MRFTQNVPQIGLVHQFAPFDEALKLGEAKLDLIKEEVILRQKKRFLENKDLAKSSAFTADTYAINIGQKSQSFKV